MIARPLTELTKGDGKNWMWTPEAEQAFIKLKQQFTSAPVLAHFDPARPVIMETDVSDFTLGAVLSQYDDENRLHPVAFYSRKFSPAEINYEIHDKELLAVVNSFKHWCRYLEGATHQVQVFSDHQNLEYFTTTKVLNRRQVRWAQELAGIDFKIYYRLGVKNGKPDAFSRHPEYRPEKGGGEDQPIKTVLHLRHFGSTFVVSAVRLGSIPAVKWSQDFLTLVREAGREDEEYGKAVRLMEREDTVPAEELQQVGRESAEGKSAGAHDSWQESRKARTKGDWG
jgi:hypothetical protein